MHPFQTISSHHPLGAQPSTPDSPSPQARSESLHSRPRNHIADQVVVDIDQDTRISPLVERRRARTAGSLGSATADHCAHKGVSKDSKVDSTINRLALTKVNTLRVVLRPVIRARSMQTNNLVPQHIRARLERSRHRHDPRIVIADQIIDRPVPRRRPVVQTNLIDFGEFERGLVDGRAVVVGAGGEVVDHGAAVAGRPGVPEELDGLAGDNGDVGFAWFAGFVADDVGGLVGVGGDLGGGGGVSVVILWDAGILLDVWLVGEDLRSLSREPWSTNQPQQEGWSGSSS
jgi:hypothetical protein